MSGAGIITFLLSLILVVGLSFVLITVIDKNISLIRKKIKANKNSSQKTVCWGMFFNSKISQESRDLLLTHILRMLLVMMKDVSLDPVKLSFTHADQTLDLTLTYKTILHSNEAMDIIAGIYQAGFDNLKKMFGG